MGLVISKGLTLRKGWQPMDPDAAAYITAVETADGQALEEKTKIAIDNFVLGCKADGIWNAIKASCILAGARTRLGALTPLVGTAPTSFNFVDGDYNRKTGLVGDGSTKYLNSNRNNNADPQDSHHLAVFATLVATPGSAAKVYIGASQASTAGSNIFILPAPGGEIAGRMRSNVSSGAQQSGADAGLIGASRASSVSFNLRSGSNTRAISNSSITTDDRPIMIFNRSLSSSNSPESSGYSDARLAFYSIGESLDLALLDARVTDLINAFGAAIP
jgi:hypothetical protein